MALQTQLAALQKKGVEEVKKHLDAALEARPTVQTRNQLRDFVRDDPFFQPFAEEAAWKELVTDEAE